MTRKRAYFLAVLAFSAGGFILTAFLVFRSRTARSQFPSWRSDLTVTGRRRESAGHPVMFVSGGAGRKYGLAPVQQTPAARPRTVAGVAVTRIRLPPNRQYMAPPRVPVAVPASPRKKLIIVFNRPGWLFQDDPHYQRVFDTCPYSCVMSDDRNLLAKADAVWVDMAQLHVPRPPPAWDRPSGQMWVAYNIESPIHFQGYQDSPAWKSVFNWTFSYRTDADFFRPYGTFELREELPAPAKNYSQIVANKTRPVAWFVSNCHSSSKRRDYVRELQKHVGVDIYGSCGNFRCPGLAEERCFRLLNTTYYFYLSFENSFCEDYVTEKLFKTYRNVDIIPIVRGAANYSQYLPPDTYLDTANFSSPWHLAQYLHSLMKERGGASTTYTDMLRTKDHFHTSYTSWVRPNLRPFCELCRSLQVSPSLSPKTYPDIMAWYRQAKCRSPTDI